MASSLLFQFAVHSAAITGRLLDLRLYYALHSTSYLPTLLPLLLNPNPNPFAHSWVFMLLTIDVLTNAYDNTCVFFNNYDNDNDNDNFVIRSWDSSNARSGDIDLFRLSCESFKPRELHCAL